MSIPLYQVDAFASRAFSGNPAAVCLLSTWLEDGVLQAIAAENNLSETAFIVEIGNRYQLRWFTPLTEVDLCGHATLASAFVILNYIYPTRNQVVFETRSGELRVSRRENLLYMDLPALPPIPCECPSQLIQGLGIRPQAVLRSTKYLVVLESENAVRSLRPDINLLKQLDLPGIIVTATGAKSDFVSRFFAPKVGVNEDPVTGSAHCILTPYWADQLGKTSLYARQISQRGGELFCELQGERVIIAGHAVLVLRGELFL